MSKQSEKRFVNSPLARLVSLVIAVVLGVFIVYFYHGDVIRIATDTDQRQMAEKQLAKIEKANNPALEACLEKRVGDVENMKKEGILSDAQYKDFKTRAEHLCNQQNPG